MTIRPIVQKLLLRAQFLVSVSPLLVLLVGLLLTALLFASVRRVESERHNLQFRESAALRIAAVRVGLFDAVEQLRVVNQLFRTVGIVSPEQFRLFAAPLLTRYPQLQALTFQRTVLHADRSSYERERQRLHPNFMITEIVNGQRQRAAVRDSYNVVDYVEPYAGNEAALGLNTADTPDQLSARRRARATGDLAATGLLSLAQDRGWHAAFLVVAPVYRTGTPLNTVAQRERAVVGETTAVFRATRLIDTILSSTGLHIVPQMAISIYAAAVADPDNLAFQEGTAVPAASPLPLVPYWLLRDRADPVVDSFDLAGHPWHLTISQAGVLFTTNHHGALFALLGGLLSTLLAAAYVYTLVSQKALVERVANARTTALRSANLQLSADLAEQVRTRNALRLHERVIEVSANAILVCSATPPDHLIEYVNPAFVRITGYSATDVLGHSLESVQGHGLDQQNLNAIRTTLREQREGHALMRNYRKDDSEYWSELFIAPVKDEQGVTTQFVFAQYDVSAIVQFEAELEFQAHHDTLTGLANRELLRERLALAIAAGTRSGLPIWVVFVDLDRFKFVNDTLGHEAGDLLLKTLSHRLQSAAREVDTVARIGGDEFVLVLPDQNDHDAGVAILRQIMDAVAQPIDAYGYEFNMTCSIGVAMHPTDGTTAETLLKHADIAMYRAKKLGRNTIQFYHRAMSERGLDRLNLETDLRYALERGELVLHYQPQVDLRSGLVIGMEALIRWQHPVLGLIQPSRFIGLAEDMGLITLIGEWVLCTACRQLQQWRQEGAEGLRMAVNLSPRQFTQKQLVQSVQQILQETGLPAYCLELELTESMMMDDVDNAIGVMARLKQAGLKISIDDFGTGYSSLAYLRRFPLDVLKIDRSFINDLATDTNAGAIVTSIIALAHNLHLQVIAEGVETGAQLAFLQAHGCDQMQGHYFSRALDVRTFTALLRNGTRLQDLPAP